MKTRFKYLALYLPFAMALLVACQEEEVPLYSGKNHINFLFPQGGAYVGAVTDSAVNYTFVYGPQTRREDTVWLELYTTGVVVDYPRPIALRQLPVDTLQALPGVHYVAFDDPRVSAAYVIPAGESRVLVPIILRRDASLAEASYSLLLGFDENEHFKPGFVANAKRLVTVSDILARPASWTLVWDSFFAPYGPVAHRFMIDSAPEGVIIDEAWCASIFILADSTNYTYWKRYFRLKLAEENDRRAALGQDPLREAPEAGLSEGRLVTF
jgi:hypothetical protein